MSSGGRIFLGIVLILMASGFLALVPVFASLGDAFPPQTTYGMGGLAAFCGLGAVACFSRASHPFTIRIIGGTLFLASLAYVASQAFGESPPPPQVDHPIKAAMLRRNQPSLVNSLVFFGIVGLPSGFAAIKGRYPGWGNHAAAFGVGE